MQASSLSSWQETHYLPQKAAATLPAPRADYLMGKGDLYLPDLKSRHFLWPDLQIFVAGFDLHFCWCLEKFQKDSECAVEKTQVCFVPFPTDYYKEEKINTWKAQLQEQFSLIKCQKQGKSQHLLNRIKNCFPKRTGYVCMLCICVYVSVYVCMYFWFFLSL